MKWYKGLYLGESAKSEKYKIFGRVVKGRFQRDTFLITLPSNPENLLDIVPAVCLLQPHYKKKRYHEELYVLGIAKGRDEALELVRSIVDEVYKATGGFDISSYTHFGRKRQR